MTLAEFPDGAAFYIDGCWQAARGTARHVLIDPVTEDTWSSVPLAERDEIDIAVNAARRAFPAYSQTSVEMRLALLENILAEYERRIPEIGAVIAREIGAPLAFATDVHATSAAHHLRAAIATLKEFSFSHDMGSAEISYDPIGVCALITPWNWPVNQIAPKVAAALAAGCTMVLKPSEFSPLSTVLFAQILHDAGVPPGVFNLVQGEGRVAGHALAAHPDVDMVSITGSVRAGAAVAHAAADSIKRVVQELGGKSANIVMPDADLETVVARAVTVCFMNAGQSCAAPSRLLVPRARLAEVEAIAARTANSQTPGGNLGPVVNQRQFDHVQDLIASGISEGARLIAGGTGRPDGITRGYFVRPTVFSDVTPRMRIAQEEIFGPVLSVMGYGDEEEAVAIANDTAFGLVAHVQGSDPEQLRRVGTKLRAGRVLFNYPGLNLEAPFGGYKQSGNGREFGKEGLREFLEIKALLGLPAL